MRTTKQKEKRNEKKVKRIIQVLDLSIHSEWNVNYDEIKHEGLRCFMNKHQNWNLFLYF